MESIPKVKFTEKFKKESAKMVANRGIKLISVNILLMNLEYILLEYQFKINRSICLNITKNILDYFNFNYTYNKMLSGLTHKIIEYIHIREFFIIEENITCQK